jgi:metal-responsive CopG/Arc/MetJ family transcriptional regulator
MTQQPKKRGRPATGKGQPVMVRLLPDLLSQLDNWIAEQPDNPSRPEAVRRLLMAQLKRRSGKQG